MSYLVLARKYRPPTFKEVVGQEAVVRTLQNAIKRQRVAHAMLFSGVRGVGKTTLARIMAKALNCQGDDAPPCGQCHSCQEISNGTSVDLHEIDGASNRGIQEIRELKENIRFQPAQSRYKIIIIDEVHMLTTEAFNALLKTLEEPPKHVYFMFATTELHKVPITILSRCQRYELKRVSHADLVAFFKKIAAKEKVQTSDNALSMIAREAGGSVRDGLSLLDQIFSFGGEEISAKDVGQVLGVVDAMVYHDLAANLLNKRLAASLDLLEQCYGQGIDLKRFAMDLLTYFRSVMVVKAGGADENILDVSDKELQALRELAEFFSLETLLHVMEFLMKVVGEMQYSSLPKMALEMAFVKITTAADVAPVESLLERLTALADAGGETQGGVPLQSESSEAGSKTSAFQLKKEQKTVETSGNDQRGNASSPLAEEKKTTSVDAEVEIERKDELPAAEKNAPLSSGSVPAAHLESKDVRRDWEGFLAHVKERKPWMAQALSLSSGAREEDGAFLLKYAESSQCSILQTRENIKLLNEYVLDFFQKDLKVTILVKGADKTAAGSVEEQGAPQEERRALANDPLVQLTAEIFDGQVAGIRTGPRSR